MFGLFRIALSKRRGEKKEEGESFCQTSVKFCQVCHALEGPWRFDLVGGAVELRLVAVEVLEELRDVALARVLRRLGRARRFIFIFVSRSWRIKLMQQI